MQRHPPTQGSYGTQPHKSTEQNKAAQLQGISGDDNGTTCVAYGPPHGWYARFAMPAMFGALAPNCG